ncbi:MAG TPA: class I SAM-dependent methyltransferase, partial [Candidatus Marinimicrobia bacterium]|nr:class I SAM-dependent methyltransferase [Candidatus Neomarinimicrobiota bacterium]
YPNLTPFDYKIVDSRWSLYGRSDLVEYRQQDMVKQLFIDGAAGSPMYRFNGNPQNPDALLLNLLVTQTTTIPFMFFQGYERDNMLVIGPGGGKEVLIGLLSGIGQITGVEVNPDFVDIVEDQSFFNGGLYTGFPNVRILVKEGRHFIKRTDQKYDLIVMALPSTEQLQNIDHLAASENYLLTVEAIQDYLKILTPEGSLIFTVHNRWELIRLIVTTLYALDNIGISNQEALNHFIILAEDYAPTIVIKKNAYRTDDIAVINNVIEQLPPELPAVTYLPYHWNQINNTIENQLLRNIRDNRISLRQYIEQDKYDISPVYDDSPYFYKISRGIQRDYLWLLIGVALFSIILITVPLIKIKKSVSENGMQPLIFPLKIFILIGIGFMIIEVTLFQKLILYLGSPTISLSVLLSSLLVGMGIGSYFGKRI